MTHGRVLSTWQYDCIRLLNESGIAESVLIINDASVSNQKSSVKDKLKSYLNKHALYKLSSRLLFKIPAYDHKIVSEVLSNIELVNCTTTRKGKFSEYFNESDIKLIRSYKLDFILRFGFNIIRGDILESAKYGVWSYHHGNELKFRGGPAGFWEIFQNSKTNGVILQKLNNLIDAGVIINRRTYQTVLHSYSEHLNKLLTNSTDMPLQVCKQIVSGNDSFVNQAHSASKAPMNRLPGNWKMLKFIVRLFVNLVKFHFDRLFRQEHWNIGIINSSSNETPKSEDFTSISWLDLRKGSKYAADSFCFESLGHNYIIFEDYDYKTKKGIISLAKLDKQNKPITTNTVLDKPFHLAYPFIFEHENNIYLIPETAENNTVELYCWDKHGEEFIFQKVLMDLPGVDASIVHYQQRWWLFCGLKNDQPNEKLHIFYSDELLGEYKPHLLNPVKVNPEGSRPAGQFIINNNVLYRPAQHSVRWYGEKIDWFRIDELTPTQFYEENVGIIEPQLDWKYNCGVHTYSQTATIKVIDAKLRKSGWSAFMAAIGSK